MNTFKIKEKRDNVPSSSCLSLRLREVDRPVQVYQLSLASVVCICNAFVKTIKYISHCGCGQNHLKLNPTPGLGPLYLVDG